LRKTLTASRKAAPKVHRLRTPLKWMLLVAAPCCALAQGQGASVPPASPVPSTGQPPLPAPVQVAAGQTQWAQFDPELLKERGLSPRVGEYFRHGARFQPGAQSAGFILNGVELGRKRASFSPVGALCFTPELVRALGLKSVQDQVQDRPGMRADEPCPDYRDFSPRTVVVLRPNEGLVELTVPPEDVMPLLRAQGTETGGAGGLFNYRGYAYQSRFGGGQTTNNYYLDTELGFNLDDWIVRARQIYTAGDSGGRWVSQSAYAQKTFAEQQQVLQAGRTSTINPLYGGIPITGAQWFPERGLRRARSFPINGVAGTRARVEVRQAGVLLVSTVVPPGPFTLTDYPLNNFGVDLQVRVIEETGSEQLITVPASSLLLAADHTQNAGLSVAAGQLWDQASVRRYRQVALASGSYGWSWGPAGGSVGALLAENYASAGVAANWRLAPSASAYGQLLTSHDARRGVNGTQASASLAWLASDTLALGASGNLRTRGFRSLQESASLYQGPILGTGTRSQMGVTASWNLGSLGALSGGVTRQNYFNGDPGYVYSLAWGFTTWRRISVQVGVSHNTSRNYLADPLQPALGSLNQRTGNFAYVNVNIPLDWGVTSTSYARRSNNETRYGTGVDQRVNDMLSYRLNAERVSPAGGAATRTETSGSVTVVPRYTSLTLGVSDRQSAGSSYYGELSGSVLGTSEGVGMSPHQVGDTFGGVKTGDVVGLRVDTPQGPVWSGPGGFAAVPYLPAYQESRLETSFKTTDVDVDVDSPLHVLRTGRGAVVNVDMGARQVRRLLLTTVDAQGQLLPSGLPVLRTVKGGGDGEYFSATAQGGRILVNRVVDGDAFYVELANGKRCTLQDMQTQPRTDGQLFESGTAVCK